MIINDEDMGFQKKKHKRSRSNSIIDDNLEISPDHTKLK